MHRPCRSPLIPGLLLTILASTPATAASLQTTYLFTLFPPFRAKRTGHGKAQCAAKGGSLGKCCNAAKNDIPIYSSCGLTFDHGYVHNVGRTSRLVSDTTISNSFVFPNGTGDSGARRGAVGTNAGSNNQIINNVLMCEGTGCSAAIPVYGDFAPVDGLLVMHNLLATTGSYCAYGGSLASKPYPEGSDIRFIDNHFSSRYFDTCGRYGPISGFANNLRGNQWTGNLWHESGEPLEL